MPKDGEPQYQSGLAYLELRDVRRAAASFQRAIDLDPKHNGARLKLAELMVSSSSKDIIQEGESRLSALLSDTPDNADVLDALAIAEARLGRIDDAQQHLEQALSKAPKELRASIVLARLKLSQKDQAGAEAVLKKAIEAAPQSVPASLAMAQFYLSLQKMPQAEAEVRRALKLDPKNGPALMILGALQMSQGQKGPAEETYREIAKLADKRYKPMHAIFLFQQGNRDAAVAEFEKLAKDDPQDRDARTRLVDAYLATNRAPAAEKVVAAAIKKNAKDIDALFQRSQILIATGRYADAKNDLMQVLNQTPDSARAHYALSKAEAGLGFAETQRRELNEALRHDPSLLAARLDLSRAYLALRQPKSALDLLSQMPAAQKRTLPAVLAHNWALLANGDQAEARKGIDQVLAVQRGPEILLQDADLKAAQKDYNGARASLEELLKSKPENVQAWTLLAQTYAAEKQFPKVVERLRAAVAQQPKSATLQFLLGKALLTAGNRAEAQSALIAARNADPRFIDADLMLAGLETEAGKLDSARQILTATLSKAPKSVAAEAMLGDVENKAGNTPAAIAQYRAVLELDQNNVLALNNLAYLMAKEDPDGALAYAERAGQMIPDNAAVQDTLGWIYYRKGMYQAALSHLKTAVLKEETPLRKYHLAMTYFKTGDRELGRQTLQAALQSDPNLAKTEVDW